MGLGRRSQVNVQKDRGCGYERERPRVLEFREIQVVLATKITGQILVAGY